ncbi:MAG: hypothetical protein U0802_18715 [Candidatus Binatia bacterium]
MPARKSATPASANPLVAALDALVQSGVRRDPFQRDPGFIAQLHPLMKLSNLYHGVELRGWRHVPRDRACLIVGNHSGGGETNDFGFLLCEGAPPRRGGAAVRPGVRSPLRHPRGRPRAAAPRRHPRQSGQCAQGAGAQRRGGGVPGGDYEVFRPWSERNRIEFGGHTGFIKVAIAARVPVVPMTIHGAHQSTFVLTRGRRLAHAAGIDRLHVGVFPFILSIPFGPTPAFMPSVQLPSKITIQFDKPLDWTRFTPRQARRPAVLRACYDEITARMQATLDHLARERPYPVLERLRELARPAPPRRGRRR